MKKSNPTDIPKLLEQAWKKFKKKDFNGSEKIFSGIYDEDQTHKEALYGYAGSLLRKKEYDQAIELLNKLMKLDPKNHEIYHLRAMCHGGNEDFEEAVEDLEKAIKIAGDRHDLYYDLGGTFLVSHDYSRAAQSFEKCIDMDGKCYEAWVGKALVAYFNKEQKAAIEFATIALKLNPKNLLALLLKALIYLETGKKSEVEREAKKIRAIDPNIFNTEIMVADPQEYDPDEDAYRTEDDEIEDFKLEE